MGQSMFAFLTATFYLWVGCSDTAGNEPNLAGLMFMWCESILRVPAPWLWPCMPL